MNNYPQYPHGKGTNGVSNREIFVGLNILSKIGVVFLILGTIAFAAASKGYIPEVVRLVLVFAVGVIMLITGELFYRKGNSRVFAFALIYGGTAELFIGSLIGYYGFEMFNEYAVVVAVLVSATVGFLLSERYKLPMLVLITTVCSIMPMLVFHMKHPDAYFFAGAAIAAIHCANAIISRKRNCFVTYILGFVLLIIQIPLLSNLLVQNMNSIEIELQWARIFMVIFAACGAFIYTSGPILNAVQDGGRMRGADLAGAAIIQGVMLAYTQGYLKDAAGFTASGIVLFILAIIYAIAAACFMLRFGSKKGSDGLFINLSLASITLGMVTVVSTGHVLYITLHIFAALVFALGAFIERRLLKVWGVVLLSVTELQFWIVYARYESMGKRLLITIVNIALWFAIMIPFFMRKKHETTSFRLYTLIAMINAGILGANLITSNLAAALEDFAVWGDKAGKAAFTSLCCAALWMLIGFVLGKLKYMKMWGTTTSIVSYGIGLICLMYSTFASSLSRSHENTAGLVMVIVTIAVNAVSVLSVLDITLQIRERAPKFAKAVGLIVSGYALIALTVVLGTNDFVNFTSFIISIIYIAMAAAWIIIGFMRRNAVLRRFGLALALFSSAKLFLFDFSGINAMGRTLLFIGFGLTLLAISFGYGIAEKSLKK